MIIRLMIFSFLASVVICHAQDVSISGVVKSSEGKGLDGVTVKLGIADIKTTTGSDGSFTLKNGTGVEHQTHHTALGNDCPFMLENNKFIFSRAEPAEIKVLVYDCNGKILSSHRKVASSKDHSITLPHFAPGIHIYRVYVNNELYTFKSVTGTETNRAPASSWKEIAGIAKQVKATSQINDALLCIKEGYQLSRIVVTKPDTSGLQITMTPLETGTVTDAEGNEYKTVKIGSQVWTSENLRSTKYNDGGSIGSACTFYKNVSDAAAKRKWGALYDYSAVKTGKLAPKGWHVPTKVEWDTLRNYLIAHGYNFNGTTTENKIGKSMAATTDWQTSPEKGAIGNDLTLNNASGFSAFPAGWRYWSGNEFKEQNLQTYWWSSTPVDALYSYVNFLWYINFDLGQGNWTIVQCSVRAVKDK